MCGVAGIISSEDTTQIRHSINNMLDLISYRGPDGQGIELFSLPDNTNLALGHNRLAIIDTSSAGLMPMSSSCDTLSIIFNGEIFNYIELKEELKELGYSFETHTDTEVLLTAYLAWGPDCLNKLNGMFAFAIFNKVNNELFIARDRYGVKPLYYSSKDNLFIFASEIKSILSHSDIHTSPESDVIGKFLLTGVINDTELTCFSGIYSLQPGHFLKISNNKTTIQRWYVSDQENKQNKEVSLDYKKAVDGFSSLFDDAVKIRLRSDVEVGACLSGGLDSSAIVGAVSKDLKNNVESQAGSFKTFSSVYDDPSISEIEYVNEVTKFTETENFSFTPQLEKFWQNASKIVWHNDEPIQSPTTFNQWSVMAAAKKENIKVTLDGQGVDELAAGYPTYYSVYLAESLRKLNFWKFLVTFKEIISSKGEGRSIFSLLARVSFLLLPNFLVKFIIFTPFLRSPIKGNSFSSLISQNYKKKWLNISKEQLFEQKSNSTSLKKRLTFDFYKISLPALLRYEDRSSMACSIEARTPFLDYRLVEYIQKLPTKYYIKDGLTKAVIRDAVSDLIPKSVFNRTDKKGYPIPSSAWLKESKHLIIEIFAKQSFLFNYLDETKLRDNLLLSSTNLADDELWRLVFTELWFREFFELDKKLNQINKHSRFNLEALEPNESR
jgi:asparagine synthase (glutamine-hydrolysing)